MVPPYWSWVLFLLPFFHMEAQPVTSQATCEEKDLNWEAVFSDQKCLAEGETRKNTQQGLQHFLPLWNAYRPIILYCFCHPHPWAQISTQSHGYWGERQYSNTLPDTHVFIIKLCICVTPWAFRTLIYIISQIRALWDGAGTLNPHQ